MKHFVDTNIALGYSFSCDKWHVISLDFISENQNIYWSNNVKKEFYEKYNEIFRMINVFLAKISSILSMNKKSFVNYYSFEKFILNNTKECLLDKTKKIKVIEFFWETKEIIFNDTSIDILLKFDSFLIKYLNNQDSNKNELENKINLYNCGIKNYLKYGIYLEKLKNRGVHKTDCKVVLDAHEFGLKNNISFNTTDEKLYKKLILCNFLEIQKYNLLN